jgi:hypothetical protein
VPDFQTSKEGSANRGAGVFQHDLAPQKVTPTQAFVQQLTNASIS